MDLHVETGKFRYTGESLVSFIALALQSHSFIRHLSDILCFCKVVSPFCTENVLLTINSLTEL